MVVQAKTNKAIVEGYIDGVLSGRIVASKMVRDACQRHRDDLAKKDWAFRFDEELAERAIAFFPLLTHSVGDYRGQPFVLYPWQMFIVWVLIGWRRVSDGLRRFDEAYLSVGRGNGKSAFAAALLLLLFGFDTPIEFGAECYTVATKEKQAKIVWGDAKRFVDHEPHLQKYIKRQKANLSIPATDSLCEPLGSDSNNTDGLRPHVVIADEVHAWRQFHRELWQKLVTAMGKRAQPLLMVITTAGTEDSDLWLEIDDIMRSIVDRSNKIEDETKFAFIAELDEDDDIFDESKWAKANPMLEFGVLKVDRLRSEAALAKRKPELRNSFQRFRANRRTSSATSLISSERWARGSGKLPPLNNLECHAGFDWGFRDDLSAMAFVFPLDTVEIDGDAKRRYAIDVDVWVPDGCPHDLHTAPWRTFVDRGELEITRGDTTDVAAIYERLEERIERHGIASIAMDPNNCREFGTRVLNDYGVDAFWFSQSCGKYNEPLLELLAALDEGRIVHGDNELLAWCACHMMTVEDTRGYRMPAKKKTRHKIDPIVAVIMALSECMFAEREEPSMYETEGMLYS